MRPRALGMGAARRQRGEQGTTAAVGVGEAADGAVVQQWEQRSDVSGTTVRRMLVQHRSTPARRRGRQRSDMAAWRSRWCRDAQGESGGGASARTGWQ